MRTEDRIRKGTLVCFSCLLLGASNQAQVQSTATNLSISAPPYVLSRPVRLTATVSESSLPPLGEVGFYDGLTFLGSALLVEHNEQAGAGSANLTVFLPAGSHTLSAHYMGSSASKASSSTAQSITTTGKLSPELQITESQKGLYSLQLFADGDQQISGSISLTDSLPGTLGNLTFNGAAQQKALFPGLQNAVSRPGMVVSADLNGDGYPDLIVASEDTGVAQILLGGPDPQAFKQVSSFTTSGLPSGLVVADFNDDGANDVAVISSATSSLQVFLADPTNSTVFTPVGSPITVPDGPCAITSGDLDNDGLPDLAVTSCYANSVSVLLNQQADPGHFLTMQTVPVGAAPISIVAADLRQLGLLDLVMANFADGTVSVLANNQEKPGTFAEAASTTWFVGSGPKAMAAADFDGDGVIDLAVCNSLDATLSILPGQRANLGAFPTQRLVSLSGCDSLAATDFDSDGLTDVLILDASDGELMILRNAGFGSFREEHAASVGPQPLFGGVLSAAGSADKNLLLLDGALNYAQLFQYGWVKTLALSPSRLPVRQLTATFSPSSGGDYASATATLNIAALEGTSSSGSTSAASQPPTNSTNGTTVSLPSRPKPPALVTGSNPTASLPTTSGGAPPGTGVARPRPPGSQAGNTPTLSQPQTGSIPVRVPVTLRPSPPAALGGSAHGPGESLPPLMGIVILPSTPSPAHTDPPHLPVAPPRPTSSIPVMPPIPPNGGGSGAVFPVRPTASLPPANIALGGGTVSDAPPPPKTSLPPSTGGNHGPTPYPPTSVSAPTTSVSVPVSSGPVVTPGGPRPPAPPTQSAPITRPKPQLPTLKVVIVPLPDLGPLTREAFSAARKAVLLLSRVASKSSVHKTEPTATAIAVSRSDPDEQPTVGIVASVMTVEKPVQTGIVIFYLDGRLIGERPVKHDGFASIALADDGEAHEFSAHYVGSEKLASSRSSTKRVGQKRSSNMDPPKEDPFPDLSVADMFARSL